MDRAQRRTILSGDILILEGVGTKLVSINPETHRALV